MSEASGTATDVVDYDIGKILQALPHRYPLLLVDRVRSITLGERIHAIKAVSMNEQFFQGHFPGAPIMPACSRSRRWRRPPVSSGSRRWNWRARASW